MCAERPHTDKVPVPTNRDDTNIASSGPFARKSAAHVVDVDVNEASFLVLSSWLRHAALSQPAPPHP